MPSIIKVYSKLTKSLEESLHECFGNKDFDLELTRPSQSDNGDITTNICLKLSKQLGKNPTEIAKQLLAHLQLPEELSKVEIKGPGFLNFFIAHDYLAEYLQNFSSHAFKAKQNAIHPTIIEYSAPNIAKPMGVHHIITTVLGQSLVNLYKFCGENVLAFNYLGDHGTQFGKLIVALEKYNSKDLADLCIDDLLELYVKFHKMAETQPELEDLAREKSLLLEQNDPQVQASWQAILETSQKDIDEVYAMLGGVEFDVWDSESARQNIIQALLEEGKKSGIFEVGDRGAFVVNYPESEKIPTLLVQRSDGASVYATRDIATIQSRIKTYQPAEIIYVVDYSQKLHFQQFFAAAKRFDWYTQETKLTHLPFGRMSFKHGAMSTRKGQMITLRHVIEKATEKILEIIEVKNPELANKKEVARKIGVGAVKYSILSITPGKDITFDWDQVLNFEGNSGPYLQYSYARTCSILAKIPAEHLATHPQKIELNSYEQAIIKKIAHFKQTLRSAKQNSRPGILCTYLYELAQDFTGFYTNCPVLSAPTADLIAQRVQILTLLKTTMAQGLELLGMELVEQM